MPASLKPDFAPRVVAWQRREGRHGLPWQHTRDAYRIWLSEIMLQQTQVSTVLRYYEAFLVRFPSVAALAAAPADEVLAAWSGLGYYSRARNLHRCAQTVVAQHGGVFPTAAAVLETLPGIGRSTAAAVAAFSCGERAAILDGNVKRVLTRVLGFEEDLARPAAVRRLWDLAEALLPEQGIEAYTQGLMDLGATVCLQRRPQCGRCPVQDLCEAHAQGRPQDFPVKTRRTVRGQRRSVLAVWRMASAAQLGSGPMLLLWQRPAQGVWAGLWSLPEWTDDEAFDATVEAVWQASASATEGRGVERLPTVTHALTHLDWTLEPRRLTGPAGSEDRIRMQVVQALEAQGVAQPVLAWMTAEQALSRGLPAPVRRLIEDETPA